MQTNNIKSFAKEARLILMDGVLQRLKYWGFNEDGNNDQNLEATHGGYSFRGQIYTETTVPAKWNKLKERLTDKQSVEDVIEEASYTWFNRLMAIKILESNGYITKQLEYAEGVRTPLIVQNAKRGQSTLTKQSEKDLLLEYLQDDKEEQAFGLLIADLCNRNKLLHDVFGKLDDYTEILLPQNLMQADGLLDLINSDAIALDDYKEVELIGWLYQFYISDKKDEVFAGFKKNKKARAEDIPAATQIFTPKWIVKYMVENTVGKVYLDYEPTSDLKEEMKYLVENDSDINNQAIITDITELTLIDPACGSGHILVTGFELLFKMYREEGYTAKQAVASILEHNLYGLDIDDRAMQLARFAVLLKAAKYDADILNKGILPHIYSFPETSHFLNEELQNFLGHDGHEHVADLREAMQLLNQGKNIGSALKLELSAEAYDYIRGQYNNWNKLSQSAGALDMVQSDIWIRLKPFLEVLLLLTKKYTSVVANPPYMGQKSMNGDLKSYVNSHYPKTKSDLFAVFMEVCLGLNSSKGLMGMINQHSWMFLSSYEKLRDDILSNYEIINMLHLGPRTFEELSGEVVQSTAFVLCNSPLTTDNLTSGGTYYRLVEYRTNTEKEQKFLNGSNHYQNIPQTNFSKIPGSPIAYWVSEREKDMYSSGEFYKNYSFPRKGIDTGENALFLKFWFEVNVMNCSLTNHNVNKKWFPYNKGGELRKWYGNRDYVVNWRNEGEEIKSRLKWKKKKPTIRNIQYHFREGFSWSTVSSNGLSCRYVPAGCLFDNGGCTLFSDNNLLYLGAVLNSKIAKRYLEFLSPTLNFQPGDIGRMLYFPPNNHSAICEVIINECIKITKFDWNSFETSWDFIHSPLLNGNNSLTESYQHWQEQVTNDFYQLHANEEELNRIFIEIYGLQEELTPEVALKDITILQDELDRNALEQLEPIYREQGKDAVELPIDKVEVLSQFVSYAIGVFLGRYRLDKPGLNIAHPNPSDDEVASYQYNSHPIEIDEDGILPLMGDNCAFPDDALVRMKDIMYAIWGEETLTDNVNFLHECLGMDLHKWLNNQFWKYHTSMYKKKPIYWLFASNASKPQNAAFKVLVYMHRMDKFTAQKIQRNYLHPHQEYLKQEREKLEENEITLSREEVKRLEQIRNWEIECRDYNEVLKNLATKQIEFDLDDGVTVNYAKFEGAVAKI
ncbi:BREX-1 system adenine-specific DNA-methyltransferase PglX [Carboxylicivirga sp. N1Y90]|uniref:BREX-1 system adenine-specific DNA-methyltransferase PglX n=1 Tax=Carboxylicivirga fragile TaxID=3417571 RepID=UPI003D335D2F|nr:BREX-1 system adenine-specific DNA-methyltransferase PglX [Marinilabiliaceae bacterium N1Y90]